MQLSRPERASTLLRYYFIFGSEGAFGNTYIEVHAPDLNEAREVMYNNFSNRWAFLHEEETFQELITKYKLECLCVIKPTETKLEYKVAFETPHFDEETEEADDKS